MRPEPGEPLGMPRGHGTFEHTADCGIEAWAPDLPGLLEECASGMFGLMYPLVESVDGREVRVAASGETIEELLVSWLGELLYVSEVESLALVSFAVDEADGSSVSGRAIGRSSATVELHGPPIKAVTYHGLSVVGNGEWRARIIFDV
ncbi:MAG TPA: archease [Acidimicrobiia bacterium]|jgi:SHS2 domain-containing protein